MRHFGLPAGDPERPYRAWAEGDRDKVNGMVWAWEGATERWERAYEAGVAAAAADLARVGGEL